jgi:hypothetical protein
MMPTLGSRFTAFEDNQSAPNLPGAPQIGAGPYGMPDWFYRNMSDAASYQAYLARNFLANCYRNADQIDGRQVARDGAVGGLKGSIKGGAASGLRLGPGAIPLGAAKGALTGSVGGAAISALRQACYR